MIIILLEIKFNLLLLYYIIFIHLFLLLLSLFLLLFWLLLPISLISHHFFVVIDTLLLLLLYCSCLFNSYCSFYSHPCTYFFILIILVSVVDTTAFVILHVNNDIDFATVYLSKFYKSYMTLLPIKYRVGK